MEVKNDNTASMLETLKWIACTVFVMTAVIGNTVYAEQPFLFRLVGVVLLLSAALGCFLTTRKGADFMVLAKDARAEVRRVVWPTKQETWTTSAIVVVAVIVSAVVLWLIDLALGALVSLLVG